MVKANQLENKNVNGGDPSLTFKFLIYDLLKINLLKNSFKGRGRKETCETMRDSFQITVFASQNQGFLQQILMKAERRNMCSINKFTGISFIKPYRNPVNKCTGSR